MGERVLGAEEDRPLANMGYWAARDGVRPSSLAAATDAMFDLVAGGASLSPSVGHVVDVGCGFGVTTRSFVTERGVQRATGINISATQLAWARRKVEQQGLSSRVQFLEASATALPFDTASIDVVTSTEAAFHFDPRATFFAEAARVLKPGGVLSMVDLLSTPARGWLSNLVLGHVSRGVQMPLGNVVTEDQYRQGLEQAGFEIERLEFIEADVFVPFRRWFFTQSVRQLYAMYDLALAMGTATYFFWPWRYPFVVARRRQGA